MYKVINGARYNTETAKELGSYSNTYNDRDLNYYAETLYLTKAGKYFLHGEGNAMSQYAECYGANSWGWGAKIIPMTEAEAQQWASEHLDADECDAIWGKEDEPKVGSTPITAILPEDLLAKLDAAKTARRCSRSEIIIKALQAYLAKE